ncbi:hypothetical protein GE061_011738 [Apolygus lucorum]|uniref:Uncharacterized protein n=1 Tax=Apolygus lucorum TaxID=248454 RepID=A0A8S9XZR5_APOLU|nr:hypothetical protein GE061_011738 [Apolygus lucorum]
MTCSHFIALLSVVALSLSSGEINEECKDIENLKTQLENFYGCCDFESMIERVVRTAEEVETDRFYGKMPLASEGHDCFMECVLKRMGAMGQDFKFIREKLDDFFLRGYPEEVKQAGKLAFDKCLSKNFSKKYCASGINGLMMCLPEELVMNCPANIWSSHESCPIAKKAIKKCPSYRVMLEQE